MARVGRALLGSLGLVVAGLLLPAQAYVPAPAPGPANATAAERRWTPGRILIRFNQNVTAMNRTEVFREIEGIVEGIAGIDLEEIFRGTRVVVVNITDGTRAPEMARRLNRLDVVQFAEPDYIMQPDQAGSNWVLSSEAVYDVWARFTAGDCKTLVCHVDSGVPYNKDTAPKYWYNPGEYAGIIGVDDDQNGVVDDFRGYNAINNNNNSQYDGHGGGTFAAMSQVVPQMSVMPCRGMSDSGDVSFSDAIKCINWCKTNFEALRFNGGNQATGLYSLSWGGGDTSQALLQTMRSADTTGVTRALFFASAGNGQGPHFPANSGLSNLVAVSAFDESGKAIANTASFVEVAAGGATTSASTPVAAGVAALMVSANRALSPEDLKAAIVKTADPLPGLGYGKLNASKAFQWLLDRGRVALASATPSQTPCVPPQVWYPPYPANQPHCNQIKYDRGCWSIA